MVLKNAIRDMYEKKKREREKDMSVCHNKA